MNVAVFGASPKPERYAYQAAVLLRQHGHEVLLVNPGYSEIEGHRVYPSLGTIPSGSIDTVTVYVGKEVSSKAGEDLIQMAPTRVIFNPGAENPELASRLESKGILTENACTLVLLRTGQF